MKKKLSDQDYLESAPIKKAISHLCVPMMLGMSVSTVYSVINAFFIGQLHDINMLSAITLSLPIFTILMAIGNVFGVGGGTFISRLEGEKKTENCKNVAGYVFYASIIVSILIAILAIIFINPILNIIGADYATYQFTKSYTTIMFALGFTVVLNFALEQLVRSEGASKESMYGVFISTALSLIFDPLLILLLKLNVSGAAYAIALANIGSSIYYMYFLETKSVSLKGFLKRFKISIKDQLEVYKIGVSELLQSAFLIVSTLLLNNFAIKYGDNVIAGFGISLRIVQIPEFLSMGMFLGMIPFFAFNFGGKNFKRFNEGVKQLMIWIGLISFIFISFVFVFRQQIFSLFSDNPSVVSIGTSILVAMLISALFNGFTGLFTGIFQATGQSVPTMIMSIAQGTLMIPVIIILHIIFGLNGIIWSMTITEVITSFIGIVLFILFSKKVKQLEVSTEI